MSMMKKASWLVASLGVVALAPDAGADKPGKFSYAWEDDSLYSRYGVGVSLGGGLVGFTDQTMRDTVTSDVGGLWDFRATLGTHTPLGIDLSYIGTAADINTLSGNQTGTLIGTAAEGALRFNVLPHYAWNPYVFAGVGWQRYDVANAELNLSDSGMSDSDNLIQFPMGGGLAYRDASGITLDVRGTFRAAGESELVLDPDRGDYAAMHSWEASAAFGYEF